MQALRLPQMFVSTRTGWTELFSAPPTVAFTFLSRVLPLSLLPPLMCAYSAHRYPGIVLPAIAPSFQLLALCLMGSVTVALEIGLVGLMASQIQLLAAAPDNPFGSDLDTRAAYSFAAVAPVPLWLSSLALFFPNRALLVACVFAGGVGSALLLRNGVSLLYRPQTDAQARQLARGLLGRAIFSWLMVVVALLGPWYAFATLG